MPKGLSICGQALYTFSTVHAQTSDFAGCAAGFKLSAEPGPWMTKARMSSLLLGHWET